MKCKMSWKKEICKKFKFGEWNIKWYYKKKKERKKNKEERSLQEILIWRMKSKMIS